MSDDLATRPALPDALRVLLADFPREAWEANPRFGGLARFWMDRHLNFRRVMGLMQADTRRLIDRQIAPKDFGARLSRLGSSFVSDLHGHHGIEDAHYFPALVRIEKRLARGFEILDADHHALDAHLEDFVQGANALIKALPGNPATEAGRFHDRLATLERFLDRHLEDEEDLIVPVILKHGEGRLG
jgi:hemerythrin-like domain-containing protein